MTKAEFLQALDGEGQKEDELYGINWLLAFAQKDLANFKKADWDRLAKDLHTFFQCTFGLAQMWREPFVQPTPSFQEKIKKGIPKEFKDRSSLISLHEKLVAELNASIPQALPEPEPISIHDWSVHDPKDGHDVKFFLRSRVVRVPRKNKASGKTVRDKKGRPQTQAKIHLKLIAQADWPSVFWLVVGDLLARHAFELTRCEECRNVFVQDKQEAFCSKKCANRYRGREWYRTHFNDPKVIDRRREKYVEKIQRELPNAKIRPNKHLIERRGHRGTQKRQRPGHFGKT